jgi:hypothetical protein
MAHSLESLSPDNQQARVTDALKALVRLLARQAAAEAVRATTGTPEEPISAAQAEPAE